MNMDGAADYPDYRFDLDNRSRATAYDDRDPLVSTASQRLVSPSAASQYRYPYAETVRSRIHSNRPGSRHSEPVSPGTRPARDIPAPGFQYGSGPLPARSTADTYRALMHEAPPTRVSKSIAPAVDSSLLGKIVADAVKRGVEESRRSEKSQVRSRFGSGRHEDLESSSRVPGAWPNSPTHASKHRSNRSRRSKHQERDYDDGDILWARDTTEQKRQPFRSGSVTHSVWEQEPEWDRQTKADGWSSPGEESWDTDQRWSKGRPGIYEGVRRRSKSRARIVRESSPPPRGSEHPSQRQRLKHGRSQKSRPRSRSHWADDMKTSSDDADGWTPLEASSDTSTSVGQSDSTLKPSHSRSQIQQETNSRQRRSRREQSQSRHQRRLSQLIREPSAGLYEKSPPSMLVRNAPTVVATPAWQHPTDVRSRQPSAYTQFSVPTAAPPPTWGCASEKARKDSAAATYLPPAPFSTVGEDHLQSRQSSGSSSWGIGDQKWSKNSSEKTSAQKRASRDGDKKNSIWGGADGTVAGWGDDQGEAWGVEGSEKKDEGWTTDAKGDSGWDVSDAEGTPADVWETDIKKASWDQTDAKNAAHQTSNDDGWGHIDTSQNDKNKGGGFEESRGTGWDQPQDDIPFNANAGDTWTAAAAAVIDKAPKKDKSRHLSSPPLAKPHYTFPPPPPPTPSIPSSPLRKIPPSLAAERGIQHQVLAGPGTAYGHAVSRPVYVDGLDKPYAVFRFKYRSRSVLRGMFGGSCLGEGGEGDKTAEWVRVHSRGEGKKRDAE